MAVRKGMSRVCRCPESASERVCSREAPDATRTISVMCPKGAHTPVLASSTTTALRYASERDLNIPGLLLYPNLIFGNLDFCTSIMKNCPKCIAFWLLPHPQLQRNFTANPSTSSLFLSWDPSHDDTAGLYACGRAGDEFDRSRSGAEAPKLV